MGRGGTSHGWIDCTYDTRASLLLHGLEIEPFATRAGLASAMLTSSTIDSSIEKQDLPRRPDRRQIADMDAPCKLISHSGATLRHGPDVARPLAHAVEPGNLGKAGLGVAATKQDARRSTGSYCSLLQPSVAQVAAMVRTSFFIALLLSSYVSIILKNGLSEPQGPPKMARSCY
ncbi:hypothetical protein MPH_10114 [Macrophomina phaseolina MS6]|uniref:Uncharacterized protein n=1 Tax=Macrophomina phaseolina (strain MS6) TaxID=1126212 RepID=K2RIN9_MACPH|nr:hypothetical protein MPH_10114 [Macrophomina phaseolina MS6]